MRCKITGFHQDDEGHWVAELECGHAQHVRHQPPWVERPWAVTPEGRAGRVGRELDCPICEPGEENKVEATRAVPPPEPDSHHVSRSRNRNGGA